MSRNCPFSDRWCSLPALAKFDVVMPSTEIAQETIKHVQAQIRTRPDDGKRFSVGGHGTHVFVLRFV